MKYYSEVLKKTFDTEVDCKNAEKEYERVEKKKREEKEKKDLQRKADAKIVEDAYEAMREAEKAYEDALNDFVKTYGSYHKTYTTSYSQPRNIFDVFWDLF